MEYIDLRSDTVTKPTPGMISAMAAAEVGDDVYHEDPAILRFEQRVAELTGKEAAIFCPTGSMTNMLGVWVWAKNGGEVLCDSWAHIARAEMGAHALLHGITMRTWCSESGMPGLSQLKRLFALDISSILVSTTCVAFENTHNFGGGLILDFTELTTLTNWARTHGAATHLDGARLWHANIETGISIAEYSALFDTVSLCFSKGLGAPVGSVLAGPQDAIQEIWWQRKRLGGGWRQAGILAAAAEYAMDHQWQRLAEDHENARLLAEIIASYDESAIDFHKLQSNILILEVGEEVADQVVAEVLEKGVAVTRLGTTTIRAVTHLGLTATQVRQAGEILGQAIAKAHAQVNS